MNILQKLLSRWIPSPAADTSASQHEPALPGNIIRPLLSGLLLVLAALWYSYDSGEVTRTDRVTVTHVVDHPVFVPPTTGSPRIGGLPGRSQREYKVFCMTVRGVRCTVNTEEYAVYRTGELITAEITLMKPAGEFGWTFLAKLFSWVALLAFGLAAWRGRRSAARVHPSSAPAILEMRNTAHPDCFAARTHRGWGVVDRDGVWRIPDRYAEIGEVRHVTIDFESVAITLHNEDRWVAAVRPEAGGLWGGIKLEKRPGEEVTQFIFASEAAVFVCVTGS